MGAVNEVNGVGHKLREREKRKKETTAALSFLFTSFPLPAQSLKKTNVNWAG
jgi:hypothetical protein